MLTRGEAMPYDLLIKGGHVLDPGQGLNATLDIGVTNGRIAAIQADIPATEAKKVVEVHGSNRFVVPGLLDIHTHVAHGATTAGVGMECCDPDIAGVLSGVTTVLDCGSVGVANVGVFPNHILPKAKTRVICFLNVGSYAHTMPLPADVNSMDEVNQKAIAACVQANPGLVRGIKLRLVGPVVAEKGEELITLSKAIASEHHIPLMVHIGDGRAEGEYAGQMTRFLLGKAFTPGDILTHLCTPHRGGVMDSARKPVPELKEARDRGVVLDPALGAGNFGYEIAREQAQLGLHPDTISSDLTAGGRKRIVYSLMECMGRFMAVGYSLSDVIRMATANAAKALGMQDELGALAVGREADITVLDEHEGHFRFLDTTQLVFQGDHALTPVVTVRAGEVFVPDWGPHPWGWLPERMAA
ncbi:MAG: amidohydrolase family protein [Chloroflexota bacterium]